MTNWHPTDLPGAEPIYVRLANRIEADIRDGALAPGDKLPPQRDLAYDLGVTIGTVGRAYALARERGLVAGEVGRGTYVHMHDEIAAPALPEAQFGTRTHLTSTDLIRFDSSAAPMIGQSDIVKTLMVDVLTEHPDEVASYTRAVRPHWRKAGIQWLATETWAPTPENVFPTQGAHAGALAAILAVTNPGDEIVLEELSYASIGRAAALMGRRVTTVPLDQDGIDTEALERLCARQHPKLLFLMPALNNPTLAMLSKSRRDAVVEIARKYNLWLIEDKIYAAVAGDPLPGLGELAPERTFVVGGLSKSVAAGLRGGFIACPPGLISRAIASHKLITGGLPFLLAEVTARLVNRGLTARILDEVRREIETRRTAVLSILSGLDFVSRPNAPFLWMAVPASWQPGTLKKAAENEGVLIDEADEFRMGSSERSQRYVRIGFSAPPSREDVERGMQIIRGLALSTSALYDTYS